LVFLDHKNIVHGVITPENILITREGIVKIGVYVYRAYLRHSTDTRMLAHWECWQQDRKAFDAHRDTQAFGVIMVQLMEREQWPPNAENGLKQPDKWSLEAQDFVNRSRVGSLTELINFKLSPSWTHPFLKKKCNEAQLIRLIVPAMVKAHTWWEEEGVEAPK